MHQCPSVFSFGYVCIHLVNWLELTYSEPPLRVQHITGTPGILHSSKRESALLSGILQAQNRSHHEYRAVGHSEFTNFRACVTNLSLENSPINVFICREIYGIESLEP